MSDDTKVKPVKSYEFFLVTEFLILCVFLPTFIIVNNYGKFMFFFLWVATAYCAYHLFVKGHENFAKDIWKWKSVNKHSMKMIIPRWLMACAFMILFLYFYEPERLFVMAYEKPFALIMVFTVYPLLSALPQELIFCSFFFHRYKRYFKTPRARIIASALVFAYAHMLYINWIAPVFSLIAGLIFAHTYSKTRSLALVTVEHALYGNAMFLIGLGWYFWSGNPALN